MIKSMTGYGRSEGEDSFRRITVEIKSVNHKYFDANIRMPRRLNVFDTVIRSVLKEYIQRGKADVLLTYEDLSGHMMSVRYNRDLAGEYLAYLREMSADFGLEDDIRVSTLSRFPEIFSMEDSPLDEAGVLPLLEKTLREALERFVESRTREGEQLKADITKKLEGMLLCVDRIEERAPGILNDYRRKLEEKAAELLGDASIDDACLASELILYADRICTDEETVRLRAHICSMLDTLQKENSIGRKLDFIAQEMNREANTILSKANDLQTSQIAIDLKTEIEKIREQIQNIE